MNSGDTFFEKKTLYKVFSTIRTEDILYGDWIQLHNECQYKIHFPYPVDLYNIVYSHICHQAMFVKSTLLKENGFDESYCIAADYCNWIKFVYNGASFGFINTTICQYDMKGVSSTLIELRDKEFKRAINENIPETIRLSLFRLHKIEKEYINDLLIKYYVKPIEKKGGIADYVMTLLLKVIKKIL